MHAIYCVADERGWGVSSRPKSCATRLVPGTVPRNFLEGVSPLRRGAAGLASAPVQAAAHPCCACCHVVGVVPTSPARSSAKAHAAAMGINTRAEALAVLGLTAADDNQDAIKRAFKRMALVHHPDKNGAWALSLGTRSKAHTSQLCSLLRAGTGTIVAQRVATQATRVPRTCSRGEVGGGRRHSQLALTVTSCALAAGGSLESDTKFKELEAARTRLTDPEPEDDDFADVDFDAEVAAGKSTP